MAQFHLIILLLEIPRLFLKYGAMGIETLKDCIGTLRLEICGLLSMAQGVGMKLI